MPDEPRKNPLEMIIHPSDGDMLLGLQDLENHLDRELLMVPVKCWPGGPAAVGQALYRAAQIPQLLPLAELLVRHSDKGSMNYQDPKSGDSIIHKCVELGNVAVFDLLYKHSADINLKNKKHHTTPLHVACTLTEPVLWVRKLCKYGCKVNEQDEDGQTALHVVLQGDVINNMENIQEAIYTLLEFGADVSISDKEGDSPLLSLRALLEDREFGAATSLANVLLEAGSDPDQLNEEGRSLLSYSVHYLDDTIELSRLLLNFGSCVWLGIDEGRRDQSAFSWFLRGIIHRRRLENCAETVELLSHVMGQCPRRMHDHVMRTMFRHVKCFRVLGPVFYQLKKSMSGFWTQPHDLKYICWKSVRRSLGPKRLVKGTPTLGLPKKLERYVLMK